MQINKESGARSDFNSRYSGHNIGATGYVKEGMRSSNRRKVIRQFTFLRSQPTLGTIEGELHVLALHYSKGREEPSSLVQSVSLERSNYLKRADPQAPQKLR